MTDSTPPPGTEKQHDGAGPDQVRKTPNLVAWAIMSELGYMIAVPAAVFSVGGAYVDKQLQTSPLFLVSGMSMAFLISALGIGRMIRRLSMAEVDPRKTPPNKG